MPAATPTKPKPQQSYPRPELVHDHAKLFQEPAYDNGQPYTDDDEDDDTEP
ncbi:hypothetical protein ACFZAR_36390 [Streptomyces sp. NPDC008222]|uniref:hypothetical protein n=1 Tax=Streptomyces sp. NPDC008222 TaxID=3364820 RepID=UPI0036E0810E